LHLFVYYAPSKEGFIFDVKAAIRCGYTSEEIKDGMTAGESMVRDKRTRARESITKPGDER